MLSYLLPAALLGALLSPISFTRPLHETLASPASSIFLDVQVYRLTLVGTDASPFFLNVDLILNREPGALKGYMISSRSSVTLNSVTVVGDTLHASVPTNHGLADLILNGTSGVLHGTFTIGGKSLTVQGERIL